MLGDDDSGLEVGQSNGTCTADLRSASIVRQQWRWKSRRREDNATMTADMAEWQNGRKTAMRMGCAPSETLLRQHGTCEVEEPTTHRPPPRAAGICDRSDDAGLNTRPAPQQLDAPGHCTYSVHHVQKSAFADVHASRLRPRHSPVTRRLCRRPTRSTS
ncbi:hypothetical protein P280DRAFT_244308 [Massarina eburnea CBS 473.64]|uniref:Uncharacterized protein n=1 Tax=Massarina eburnea CBS 473.64 TaxID=1395130 RepID=A0A6A6S8P3_9PLEO|nr:hypothetical protein P280DRAFT_244308 [Massarina eburnea CBS 473.64]